MVSARRSKCADPGAVAQAAVYQRAVVDPGSSGRRLCAFDRSAERQDRGLVHSVGIAGRAGCRWIETPHHTARIARARSGTARLPISFNGARFRRATPSSFLPEPSTPSAAASCLRRYSNTATRPSVMFDYGRQRELNEDNAVAASDAGPVQTQSGSRCLTDSRTASHREPAFRAGADRSSGRIRAGRCLPHRRPGFS